MSYLLKNTEKYNQFIQVTKSIIYFSYNNLKRKINFLKIVLTNTYIENMSEYKKVPSLTHSQISNKLSNIEIYF